MTLYYTQRTNLNDYKDVHETWIFEMGIGTVVEGDKK